MTTSFANLLRDLRNLKKLSRRELAERAGLHHNHIGQFEGGFREPSYRNLVRLARALDVELSAFDPQKSSSKS